MRAQLPGLADGLLRGIRKGDPGVPPPLWCHHGVAEGEVETSVGWLRGDAQATLMSMVSEPGLEVKLGRQQLGGDFHCHGAVLTQ